MAWLILVVAGLVETAWAVGVKFTDGFTRPVPTLLVIVGGTISVWLLSIAARTLPIGTAYAVWTGIGATLTAILGMLLFNESRDWTRLACIALIIVGIIGLERSTSHAPATKAPVSAAGASTGERAPR